VQDAADVDVDVAELVVQPLAEATSGDVGDAELDVGDVVRLVRGAPDRRLGGVQPDDARRVRGEGPGLAAVAAAEVDDRQAHVRMDAEAPDGGVELGADVGVPQHLPVRAGAADLGPVPLPRQPLVPWRPDGEP
jgi:hypothetical protein